MSKLERVGEIGVDAGLCWIGDPCYIIHNETPNHHLGRSWQEFCDELHKHEKNGATQFHYNKGHAGLGVCVSTGYGDGCYPVYVERNEEGRVKRLVVEFID